jgi:SAM-dependent methyltransferase
VADGLALPLRPLAREVTRLELLDEPGTVLPAELAACLRDIARLNRLGALQTVLKLVDPFLARHRGPEPFRVLDLGTGLADIPAALVRRARQRGQAVRVLALDLMPEVLACAGAALADAGDAPEVRLVAGEALRPPIRPGSVDLAICSLMLHHLPEPAVIETLRLMATTARRGFVISDLRRTRAAYVGTWLLTRVITRNRLARHDGPLSVLRAYTVPELERLSAAAGVRGIDWRDAIALRLVGVSRRADG